MGGVDLRRNTMSKERKSNTEAKQPLLLTPKERKAAKRNEKTKQSFLLH